MTILGPADNDLLQKTADHWHLTRDFSRHLRRPIPLLMRGEKVTGQREAEHDLHENQAEPEVHLARRAVGPVDNHLHEVQRKQDETKCLLQHLIELTKETETAA